MVNKLRQYLLLPIYITNISQTLYYIQCKLRESVVVSAMFNIYIDRHGITHGFKSNNLMALSAREKRNLGSSKTSKK